MPQPRRPLAEHVQAVEADERTPSCIVLTIYAHEFEAMKEHTTQAKTSLRSFFSAAYAEMVKIRKEWERVHEGERYPWRASPQLSSENDDVILVYVWLPVLDDLDLREWADTDSVTINDAAYSAALLHLASEQKNV